MTLVAPHSGRLDKILAELLPEFSRSRIAKHIGEGKVRVGGEVLKAGATIEAGTSIELEPIEERAPHDLTPAEIPLDIVYESEACLVVNKPRGLATHPAASLHEPSLVNALLGRGVQLSEGTEAFRPGIVHRLDKETTGLIVVAKNDAAHSLLSRAIEDREVNRMYLAIAAGRDELPARFQVEAAIARDKRDRERMAIDSYGKSALTYFKNVMRLDRGQLLACRLATGRTHQIRIHLQSVGHPVLGDRLYSPKEWGLGPLALHAAYLSFEDPAEGDVALYQPPPDDFSEGRMSETERLNLKREIFEPF